MKVLEKLFVGMTVMILILAHLLGFGFAIWMLVFPFTAGAAEVDPEAVWFFIFPLGFVLLWFMIGMLYLGLSEFKTGRGGYLPPPRRGQNAKKESV